MPITQARMLGVLQAGAAALRHYERLRAIAQSPGDDSAKLRELRFILADEANAMMELRLIFEREAMHFAAKGKENDRKRRYLRRKRGLPEVSPKFEIIPDIAGLARTYEGKSFVPADAPALAEIDDFIAQHAPGPAAERHLHEPEVPFEDFDDNEFIITTPKGD